MAKIIKIAAVVLVVILVAGMGGGYIYLRSRLPIRSGTVQLPGLDDRVTVRFDQWAIPHIEAKIDEDAFYVLGYLHAQDRLFQMEVLRRLAKGQLSEILGPSLISTDSFFRTLRLKQFGEEYLSDKNLSTPAFKLCRAYMDGVNRFIRTRPAPVEFDLLKIPKTEFTLSDMVGIAGYMAYSFAEGFKTDPLLTHVREKLGPAYLNDLDYRLSDAPPLRPLADTRASMEQLAALVDDIQTLYSPVGFFKGSNAWAVKGDLTASGKPILAGDPHIAHSCPPVWYEAHIITPTLDLYGHHLAGFPLALMGFNRKTAWTLTMFENDDVDLFREKVNPDNPDQVWSDGRWQDLVVEHETIAVKGEADVELKIRRSAHGPIVNDILDVLNSKKEPVAVSWSFHDPKNDFIQGLYELHRMETIFQAPEILSKIHSPGLNFVMADTAGNIGWWAVGRLPIRPDHVNSHFILDGSDPSNDYQGFLPFEANPQFINPASGIIISANHQPQDFGTGVVPGYYSIENRARRIETLLDRKPGGWTADDMKAIQLDSVSTFYTTIKNKQAELLETLPETKAEPSSAKAFDIFKNWDGSHGLDSVGASIFNTLHYHLARLIFEDEMEDIYFKVFLGTNALDRSVLKLMDLDHSPWWDNCTTPGTESRIDILQAAWKHALADLKNVGGDNPDNWRWENFHSVEYVHAIGRQKPMDRIFNIGPFKSAGGREVPNYQGFKLGPPPFKAYIGPSTRRIIDFADPDHSFGINPTGQSGYFFDPHYDDQASLYMAGGYRSQLTDPSDIQKQSVSTLTFTP